MGLRIGFVSGEFPPMVGGVGAFTLQLAKSLAEAGHQIHVISDRRARPVEDQRSLWDIREPIDTGFAQLHPRVNRWWWSSLSVVAEIVSRYDLQIVNLQYQALAYSMVIPAINFLPWRLKGLSKTIVTFHDLRTPYLFPKAGSLREWVLTKLATLSDGVILTNSSDYHSMQSRLEAGIPLREIKIGSNIDPRQVDPHDISALRHRLEIPDECLIIGYFGFISESKGADSLLSAMALLEDQVYLIFIGGSRRTGGSASDLAFSRSIEGQIDDLGLTKRVRFTGFLDNEEVSTHLHAADMLVMPYRDGASLRRGTLMASLAHGRPLVTTAPVTPTPELVHGQNVWITPIDDPGAIAEAINLLWKQPELRKRLAEGAKLLSGKFAWYSIAQETAAFFEQIALG